jgi:hypothetical protein
MYNTLVPHEKQDYRWVHSLLPSDTPTKKQLHGVYNSGTSNRAPIFIHYRIFILCRVSGGSPSVFFQALGKKSSLSSAKSKILAECFFLALGKENFHAHFEALNKFK